MLIENEHILRPVIFFSGLISFWLIGLCFPYRTIGLRSRRSQWFNNLFLVVFNALTLRFLAPVSLTLLAAMSAEKSLGLLNYLQFSDMAAVISAIILLDLGIYWQHRLTHKIPILWRMHRLHHSDTEIDVTTAGRFHVLEIFISYILKVIMILAIGAPASAVIIFEVLLNFCAMFNHTNISLPKSIEAIVRSLIVTPDMHRIHHSSKPAETDSNYGFCLSIWDRIFKSYNASSKEDDKTMEIGLKEFRSNDEQKLTAMLLQPFK